MSLADGILLIFILLLLLYALYDELVINLLRGKTLLRIRLKRRNRLDCLIFVGLITILIYHNVASQGTILTTYLLISLALIAVYISYLRWPKMLFKATGFFYANVFIDYQRIKAMNLSEDGILVIDLEQRRLLIHVTQLDDLEVIYHFFAENKNITH